MLRWYVVVLAALAVILLLGGLLALVLPEDYEGQEVYRLDRRHTLRMLDVWGGLLLVSGSSVAWLAGVLWQRNVRSS